MSEKFEKPANDYDKPELVYAVSLLFHLQDMQADVNKLSKKALWRLYDQAQARGIAFANLEDDLRTALRERNEWETRALMAERKVKTMEGSRGKRTKSRK